MVRVRLRQVPALMFSGPRARVSRLRWHPKRRPCGQVIVVACCGLTSHSSRCRFAARLNSGVRRQSQHSSVWAVAIISGTVLPASCSSVRHPAMRAGIIIRNCIGHVRSCSPRRASTAGSWLAIVSASPAKVQGRRAQALVASAASQGKGLSPPGFRRSVTPNNSFKPTPLRGAA